MDSGIFTCFILYASIYGIGPFVYSWTLDYEYLWSRYSAYRLTVYTVCARVHIGKPDVFNKKKPTFCANFNIKDRAKDYKAAPNNSVFLRELKLNQES